MPDGAAGVQCRDGVRSGVGSGAAYRDACGFCCVRWMGRGVPVPFHLLRVARFFTLPCWRGIHPSNWLWRSIVGCHTIAACLLICSGSSTPRVISSGTSAPGSVIRYCVSSNALRENPPLAILTIFHGWRMLNCFSCSRLPFLAIVADMLKTYKKLVAVCNNEIWLVPQPYTVQ